MKVLGTMAVGAGGARAAEVALAAAAHNVANLNTGGFRASRASFADVARGGVTASLTPTQGPAPLVARGDTFVRGSDTDLVAVAVGRATAAATYRANLRMAGEASGLVGTLLDIVG